MAHGLSEVTGQPEAEFGLAARAYTPSPWHRPRGLWASWCQAAQRLLLLKPARGGLRVSPRGLPSSLALALVSLHSPE